MWKFGNAAPLSVEVCLDGSTQDVTPEPKSGWHPSRHEKMAEEKGKILTETSEGGVHGDECGDLGMLGRGQT